MAAVHETGTDGVLSDQGRNLYEEFNNGMLARVVYVRDTEFITTIRVAIFGGAGVVVPRTHS